MSETNLVAVSTTELIPLRCIAGDKYIQINKAGELEHNPAYSLLDCLNAVIASGDPISTPIAQYLKATQGGTLLELQSQYYQAIADGDDEKAEKLYKRIELLEKLVK